MKGEFKAAYASLNEAQKKAVDHIDGPLLVIAGPGTGKTHLLSTRVANILDKTDALPNNVLCLTYTDNAARNMRERLQQIIGRAAYHVNIHTFHSFGRDIFARYPEHFSERYLLEQIDELGQYELLKQIFEDLPHSNPLSARLGDDYVFLKDTLEIIGWLKENALTPDEFRNILLSNQKIINKLDEDIKQAFAKTPSRKDMTVYENLLIKFASLKTKKTLYGFPDYAEVAAGELERAILGSQGDSRYVPAITAWRTKWCQKDAKGEHVLKDSGRNMRKMLAVADIYEKLNQTMQSRGLYDFDDMIIEAVHALENDDELRYTIQEQYQYILVDEFQDTNKAQVRILHALGNNPVFENKPNIMAVGDDKQAVYAFQGAEVSNMLNFASAYETTELVTLNDNYRSSHDILEASLKVAGQINDRLSLSLKQAASDELIAKREYKSSLLTHLVYESELAQYESVAKTIKQYVDKGIRPEQIAVIAPRHRYLERLVPYLGHLHIPVAYERREDILDSPIIIEITTMAKLIDAIAHNNIEATDALLSTVLSYDFWGNSSEVLIQISIECYKKHKHWLEVLIEHKDTKLRDITNWFVDLGRSSQSEPLEYILDKLVGGIGNGIDSEYDELAKPTANRRAYNSPFKDYYFSPAALDKTPDSYLTLLGQLSTLRQHLRSWKPSRTLFLADFIEFVDLHKSAKLKIIDSNPHTQTTNAVQVMSAHKAKGLEFDIVFLINVQDEVWGPTAKSYISSLTLPKNLPLKPASDADNDKLRTLFVALTRARHSLYMTSYTHTLENRLSPGLSFLIDDSDQPLHEAFKPHQATHANATGSIAILSTDWSYRYRQIIADKPSLFGPILADYKLSVTHLNNFIDVASSGPNYFLVHNLLRFPAAPTPSAIYGDAVHKTLQWAHIYLKNHAKLPAHHEIAAYFDDVLSRKQLRSTEYKRLKTRGELALRKYFDERADNFSVKDMYERGFNNEGVLVNEANLSGKIDKLHFTSSGQVEVIDFKTGQPATSWQGKDDYEKIKLHKYRQQLLFYKLLIEKSASFSGKLIVNSGALEFIEPGSDGSLEDNLELEFGAQELEKFISLVSCVWHHIKNLNFPDVSHYPKNYNGVMAFEKDLLDNKI